jgi:hypothetical protein
MATSATRAIVVGTAALDERGRPPAGAVVSSVRLFHAPQFEHWPTQRGWLVLHSEQR